jgi:predicted dienelactone hydrolase
MMLAKNKWLGLAVLCLMMLSVAWTGASAQDEKSPVSVAGAYQVGTQILTLTDTARDNRELQTFVWYPALGGKDTPRPFPPDASGSPYPLIIYSHGFGGSPTELTPVIERLVSHGFVVAALDHRDLDTPELVTINRPLDVLFLLNQLAALPDDSPLAGIIDTDHVGVTGFSMGGFTTVAVSGAQINPDFFKDWCAAHPDVKPDFYCDIVPIWDTIATYHDQVAPASDEAAANGMWQPLTDERIKAVFALAPCRSQLFGDDGLASVTIPTFIVGATNDESCPYDLDASNFYAHLGSEDRSLVTLDKRTHIMVIRELPLLMQYETAFFGLHLQGKSDYAQYLAPDTASAFRNVTVDVPGADS